MVLDREQEFLDRLPRLINTRPHGTSPAAALRDEALALVDGLKSMSADQARGVLGYQAAVSAAVRRLCLEMTDRLADAMAAAIAEAADGPPTHVARLQAVALAWVFQTITAEGRPPTSRRATPIPNRRAATPDRWLSHP